MTNVASAAALISRVLIAYFFVTAGFAKLGDISGSMAYTASGGLPGFFAIPALALEILGGLAILVGWQTRWAAFALAAFTLVAGVLFHYLPAQSLEGMNAYVQLLMFNLIRFHAVLSRPFIPDAAAAMLAALGLADAPWPEDVTSALEALGPGHGFSVPEVLFAKIDDARREALEAQFAGA